ncbi:Acetolactate synthase large subunit [plant metagenome]|uniref:Acetolactate synthase large subunit n=1 Tax=plant metagenome TaxID=1297885 RepID=A0A484UPG4_9ZZZZ
MEKRVTGGQLLASTLKTAKVSKVFALHGGHLEAFYKGCAEEGLALVDTRHEAVAGHAAEGYARATGKLGVCVITAGPGFGNAITAIMNAYLDASPVLFIIGAAPLREAETNPLQGGFDQIAVATPISKRAFRITNTERIPDLIAMAIRTSMTGRRGPVVVEVPIDVLHMTVPLSAVTRPAGLFVAPKPAPSLDETRKLLDLLESAERPVIIAGGDARFSGCEAALKAFAESSGIPVFQGKRGYGLLPAEHPLNGHDASNLGALTARAEQGADLVILLGTRLGLFLGGRGNSVIPANAKLVQIYSDAAEIGRIRDVELAVAADSDSTLKALLTASAGKRWPNWKAWSEKVCNLKKELAENFRKVPAETPLGVHPYHAMAEVAQFFGSGAIYAVDGGEAGQWAVNHTVVDGPGRVQTTGYLGALGVAQGYAIGAQVACPSDSVVLVTGDGSLGFQIQEFDSMVRHGLPITTVVLNNEIWGMSLHGQQIMYGEDYSAISRLGGTNYALIAEAFGCYGERVERLSEIIPALERARASGKPACIEIMTDPDVVSPGLVRMLGNVADDGSEIMIPYYENIPKSLG